MPQTLMRLGVRLFWPCGGGGGLFVSFAWLAGVTWLILRAINQRGLLPRVAVAPPPDVEQAPCIAVVVPARDEAGNIRRCLNSLLA